MANQPGMFSRILVPTDFSEQSRHALGLAQRLARALGSELTLLHVLSEATLYDEGFMSSAGVQAVIASANEWAERKLAEWADATRAEGAPVKTAMRTGPAHREIVAAAKEMNADLIVIGTHGRGGLDRMLLGSVAERVVRLAPCAVLSVRTPDPADV
jgi:nucleotide-binding universal stress UspA family protein